MLATSPFDSREANATARRRWRSRVPSLAAVIALHVAVLIALLHYEPVRDALASAAPIMVSLVTPPRVEVAPPEPPKPKVEPPKPKPAIKPVEPARIVAAPVEAPAPFVAPAPPPEPPPPVEAAPAAPVVAVAPPAPVIPPSFDADYLHNPAPPYPPLSRRAGEQGRVVLRVYVGADGSAEKVELRTSSGSPRLDEAALDTVKRWKFVPARQGDRPVAAWVLVPISFSLKG